ncbi:MAG: carboxypeptidase-like regulatory domain-containing protein [Muribaculaceae bacterium]|nr:carboxypeptidase-like regulatory domain-containing protein [Muribaculaceae bacterium]
MKNLFIFLSLLFGLWIVPSCSSDLSEEIQTGSIAGSVADATTGEPVATVNVTLTPGGKSTVTGSDGSFYFHNLEPGEYAIDISKEGYSENTKSINVKAGDATPTHLLIERLPASITADKSVLEFGDQVQTLSFTIVNRDYRDLEYSIETGSCNWLSVKPNTGSLKYGKTETIVVNLLRDKLPLGSNEAMIVVRSLSGGGNVEIKVTAVNGNATATVNTLETSDITNSTAVLNGEIQTVGEPPYTERGFVYSTSATPTIDNCVQKLSCPVNDKRAFSCKIENLATLKTYYVRAYLVQNSKVAYGNTVSFTTTSQPTEVTTSAATNVEATTATVHGSVTKAGNPAFTEKGFVYCKVKEQHVPEISDNRKAVAGTSVGDFSLDLTGLDYPVKYYVRSYAIQGGNVVYGNTVSFSTTSQTAVVSTSAVTGLYASEATFNGTVQNAGKPAYTERGFCYSRYGTPSISTNKVTASGTGTGAFSVKMNNLDYPATYYVCAYVMQGGTPIYGNVVTFSTETRNATVNTTAATDVTLNSATLNGIITDLGIPAATRRGFCYSEYTNSPTISDKHVDDYVVNTSYFKKQITGLEQGTKYYVRAYAFQNDQYVYGNVVTFTTNTEPLVHTELPTNLAKEETMFSVKWSVTFNGTVLDTGNPKYSTRGFIYGKNYNPDPSSGTIVTVSGTGTGRFSTSVKNLQDMQTYYVRAFVRVGNKYYYGACASFSTY